MTDDLSWSARMSARAKAREQAWREAVEEERAEAARPWREFVEARGGTTDGHIHDGWFAHSHPAHGACVVDARTGALIGVPCIVIDENDPPPPPPEECPVCRDVDLFLGTLTGIVRMRGLIDGEYHGSPVRRLTDAARAPVLGAVDDYWPS